MLDGVKLTKRERATTKMFLPQISLIFPARRFVWAGGADKTNKISVLICEIRDPALEGCQKKQENLSVTGR